jgi:hypothetical protein
MILSHSRRSVTRPDSPSWLNAKHAGDIAEQLVADWFRERGYDVLRSVGEAAGFDLLCQCRIEVKRDLQAATTGNVAIEVSRNGEASGINTSTAVWWAIITDAHCYLVRRSSLLNLLTEGHRLVPSGDRLATRCVLVPVERVAAVATNVTDLARASRPGSDDR